MKLVVFESHWGNTAAIARAICEGLGPDARALTTDEADDTEVAAAEIVVAGAPVIGFRLTTDKMHQSLLAEHGASGPADLSHPSMRTWLEHLPPGSGRSAAFETRIRWSPGGATGAIDHGLRQAGFRPIDEPHRFVVTSKYGPLRDGELERARAWGRELARELESEASAVPVRGAGPRGSVADGSGE